MDILDKIALEVGKTIEGGYYTGGGGTGNRGGESECSGGKAGEGCSLLEKLNAGEFAIISEIKPASPSEGKLLFREVGEVAREMGDGGASAISVLTEPTFFSGKLGNLGIVKRESGLPVLMKDFVIGPVQLEAGKRAGADLVLLIVSLFERGYCSLDLEGMIGKAHELGLEVLLEAHTAEEFEVAKGTDADILGINNRNLGSMEVSIGNTLRILGDEGYSSRGEDANGQGNGRKPVISESGIFTREDVLKVKNAGASGVLVGTSILQAGDIVKKLQGLRP
jgi:indole-3-glycerol phosphate synthase